MDSPTVEELRQMASGGLRGPAVGNTLPIGKTTAINEPIRGLRGKK